MENTKNLQKNLYVLVGTPGSGKSTWVQKQNNGTVISRDVIRFALLGKDDEYFASENQVFSLYIEAIQRALDNGENVFADATHLNEASRNKLLRNLNLNNVQLVAVNFNVPLNVCFERNNQRSGRAKVPESAVRRMFYSKSDPMTDTKIKFNKVIDIDENGKETVRYA